MRDPKRLSWWTRAAMAAFACAPFAVAQSVGHLRVAASGPGEPARVVLVWARLRGASGYNLYRRPETAAQYPPEPLNAAPLAPWTDCAAIKQRIPPGGEEWELLATSLPAQRGALSFDPCAVASVQPATRGHSTLQMLAGVRWRIAVVAGLGYEDVQVAASTRYLYRLRAVNAAGQEFDTLATDLAAEPGQGVGPPPPAWVTTQARDHQVLLRWGDVAGATGFVVLRAATPAGPFQPIHDGAPLTTVGADLYKKSFAPLNGQLDYRRWTLGGDPESHAVVSPWSTPPGQRHDVVGPVNGETYYYSVLSVDLLGRAGPPSAPAEAATPVDTVRPRPPASVVVHADEAKSALIVSCLR